MDGIINALVFGKGVSGDGACYALRQKGVSVTQCDDNDFDLAKNGDYDLVVVSPGVSKSHDIFSIFGDKIISEIELGSRLCRSPYIAITGTNGKTTTSLLTTKLLEKKYSVCVTGNIGRSFSRDALDDKSIFVCETSSFQLENIRSFKPCISAITNIDCDHIDRHGDIVTYAKEKLKIAKNQTKDDFLIMPCEDIPLYLLSDFTHDATVIYTSVKGKVKGSWTDGKKIFWYDEEVGEVRRIRLRGLHNLKNILIAVAIAKLLGVNNEDIREVLSEFTPPNHRIKYLGSVKGISFYNDSKGTNIGATKAGMQSMEMPYALIVGGSDKGCSFDELFADIPNNLKKICVVGENADKIIDSARRNGFYKIVKFDKLSSAVCEAYHSGADCVLFSPASASFDAYENYKKRGEAFEKIFEEIKKSETR